MLQRINLACCVKELLSLQTSNPPPCLVRAWDFQLVGSMSFADCRAIGPLGRGGVSDLCREITVCTQRARVLFCRQGTGFSTQAVSAFFCFLQKTNWKTPVLGRTPYPRCCTCIHACCTCIHAYRVVHWCTLEMWVPPLGVNVLYLAGIN